MIKLNHEQVLAMMEQSKLAYNPENLTKIKKRAILKLIQVIKSTWNNDYLIKKD